jgi:hypothetical protein
MTIRTFQTGDDAALVGIYNEAAGRLPHFKPATLDEVRRRCTARDFDPEARYFAVADGRAVGYVQFRANGRVSYPWCRPGYEHFQGPLLETALGAMRQRKMPRALAAYRGDWPLQEKFFLDRGFARAREMVNFLVDLTDLPTPAGRSSAPITPMSPADVPAVFRLAQGVSRTRTEAELEDHLFGHPDLVPDDLFVLRGRGGAGARAGFVLVANDRHANPHEVNAGMPCFWMGAFGTEGMQTKRVNGLFSFVTDDVRNISLIGLELLSFSALRLQETNLETLAAQVPSDAEPLLRFYQQYFQQQGSFPIYEREL